MWDAVIWLYLVNSVLLILHEMDSAYWREWQLFRLPGGIAGFLVLHAPLYAVALYGLVRVSHGDPAGLWLSLVVALAGLFAFGIHTHCLRRGHPEFGTPASRRLLALWLATSLAQLAASLGQLIW